MTQTKMKGEVVSFNHPNGLKFELPASDVKLDPGEVHVSLWAYVLLDPEDMCAALGRHVSVDWEKMMVSEHGPDAVDRMPDDAKVSGHSDRNGYGFAVVTFSSRGKTKVVLEDEFPPLEE